MSFRLNAFSSLPRTGLPERFASYSELRRHLDMLIRNGVIENTNKMWWDVRPNPRFPTVEVRVMDCCTSIDDSMCLASLVVCLDSVLDVSWRLSMVNCKTSLRVTPNEKAIGRPQLRTEDKCSGGLQAAGPSAG